MEKASPLKSITQNTVNSTTNSMTNGSGQQDNNLAALKAIALTPPTSNRQNTRHNGISSLSNNNNNFNNNNSAVKFQHQFSTEDQNSFFSSKLNSNTLNSTSNGCRNVDKKLNESDFIADFSNANIYNSSNSLNSNGSGGTGHNSNSNKVMNGTLNGDLNANFANFADFENNKIYNAAGEFFNVFLI